MRCSAGRFKIILAALIVLCPLTTTRGQSSSDSGTELRALADKARASMVVVTGEDRGGQPITPGLGFFITHNLIATDNRVIASARRLFVKVPGREETLDVSYCDSYRFASILTLATGPQVLATPLSLGVSDNVAEKDKVYMLQDSEPNGAMSEGVVRKLITFMDRRYFQTTARMKRSSRGGPVFNNKGEVIGIAAESPDGQSLGFVIPVSYLATLLQSRRVAESSSGPGNANREPAPSSGPGQGQTGSPPATSVTTRPVVLNNVRPRYTEVARTNHTQGVVNMRILIGEDGNVTQTRITKGLPDGLNEQATAAAYQMKFKPATRNGQAVSYWVPISVEFNLR